jgi:hypothetical protein
VHTHIYGACTPQYWPLEPTPVKKELLKSTDDSYGKLPAATWGCCIPPSTVASNRRADFNIFVDAAVVLVVALVVVIVVAVADTYKTVPSQQAIQRNKAQRLDSSHGYSCKSFAQRSVRAATTFKELFGPQVQVLSVRQTMVWYNVPSTECYVCILAAIHNK